MDIEALEQSVVFDGDWRRYEQQFMERRAEAAKASDIDAKLLSLMPGQPTARRNLQSWDLSTRGTSVPVPPYRLEDKPDGAEWDTEVLRRSAEFSDRIDSVAGATGTGCSDELATNTGTLTESCKYECADLIEEYFPDKPSDKTRCYVYDADAGGWPAALLDQKQTEREFWQYLAPTSSVGGTASAETSFTVGDEPENRRVQLDGQEACALKGTSPADDEALCAAVGLDTVTSAADCAAVTTSAQTCTGTATDEEATPDCAAAFASSGTCAAGCADTAAGTAACTYTPHTCQDITVRVTTLTAPAVRKPSLLLTRWQRLDGGRCVTGRPGRHLHPGGYQGARPILFHRWQRNRHCRLHPVPVGRRLLYHPRRLARLGG